jgi:glycolate oxidase FAD binding subunit
MPCWDILASRFPVSALPAQTDTFALCPSSIVELQEILQLVSAHGEQMGICGNGSKLHWRSMPSILVSTRNLPAVLDHAVDDLTVTVSAGTPYQELQTYLAKTKQFLAIDPPYPHQCTIGGIIGSGMTGSLRHRYGGVRDMVLGIEFLRSDGVMARAGGKVVKNVAGYDLMKLLTGAWGTLAIVTAVTLRLYPLPPHQESWIIAGAPFQLKNLLSRLWRSGLTPTIVDLFSPRERGGELLIQFTGMVAGVTAQGQQLQHLVQASGDLSITKLDHAPPAPLYSQPSPLLLVKIAILPSYAPDLIYQFPPFPMQIHAGSGIGWVRIDPHHLPMLDTFCSLRKGYVQVLFPNTAQRSPMLSPLLSQRLKQQLDRSSIFPSL